MIAKQGKRTRKAAGFVVFFQENQDMNVRLHLDKDLKGPKKITFISFNDYI